MIERERKTAVLTLRITPRAKAVLAELAAEDQRSLSTYIERLILRTYQERDGSLQAAQRRNHPASPPRTKAKD